MKYIITFLTIPILLLAQDLYKKYKKSKSESTKVYIVISIHESKKEAKLLKKELENKNQVFIHEIEKSELDEYLNSILICNE